MILETFDEYEHAIVDTAVYPGRLEGNITYPALGLSGEAGEVAEKVKKILRDKGGVVTNDDAREILKELGDCLWYITALATELHYDLQAVAETNVEKLLSRLERNKIGGSGDNR